MYGRVTKYFRNKKFGFIQGDDGNTYFVHHSKLNGEYIERGYYVFFKPYTNDRSDFNARGVIVIEAPERIMRNGKKHK
ncbi:cold-shock protein [Hungatella effluvii]|uniref:cold-shock protein n=1 Tax=Hungatella effluvii TaxID=1096246 RepID=UPI0022E8EB7C|nr:cold shock domain-containing protein [Hungatella effluvii]